jgi:hypothetical protein
MPCLMNQPASAMHPSPQRGEGCIADAAAGKPTYTETCRSISSTGTSSHIHADVEVHSWLVDTTRFSGLRDDAAAGDGSWRDAL